MYDGYVRNRPSPADEDARRAAYLKANPKAALPDGLDISAVITIYGEPAHALLPEGENRSQDNALHWGKDIILDCDLAKYL